MKPLQLLDTFSGIGGFSLAASWCRFSDGTPAFETVGFVEIEPFPQAVLRKHWPDAPILSDIKETNAITLRQRGIRRVDCLSGGVPCQPASLAGARKGAEDARWLWPEFLRLVRELRPLYVLAENPRGIASLEPVGLDWIRDELAAAGYQSEVILLAASDIGATHQRDRLWIVAHSKSGKTLPSEQGGLHAELTFSGDELADANSSGWGEQPGTEPGGEFLPSSECRCSTMADNAERGRRDSELSSQSGEDQKRRRPQQDRGCSCTLADAESRGGVAFGQADGQRTPSPADDRSERIPRFPPHRNDFRGWATVASVDASFMPCVERKVLRVANELSPALVQSIRRRTGWDDAQIETWWKKNKVKVSNFGRNRALKAYGNSIVPSCAYVILQSIVDLHEKQSKELLSP